MQRLKPHSLMTITYTMSVLMVSGIVAVDWMFSSSLAEILARVSLAPLGIAYLLGLYQFGKWTTEPHRWMDLMLIGKISISLTNTWIIACFAIYGLVGDYDVFVFDTPGETILALMFVNILFVAIWSFWLGRRKAKVEFDIENDIP